MLDGDILYPYAENIGMILKTRQKSNAVIQTYDRSCYPAYIDTSRV
jgi:hypothetical protein